jgi:hypothetical protein
VLRSQEAYDGYLAHPAHDALVGRWMPRIVAMRVIDVDRR